MFTRRRILALTFACFCFRFVASAGCPAADRSDVSALKSALTFHADFDRSMDAAFAKGDAKLYTATSLERKDAKPGNHRSDVSIVQGGRFGRALRFKDKSKQVVFYRADGNMAYRGKSWSGTVSLWMRVNPDKDLKPGYADPIQITDKRWNDGAFFLDFTKDDKPRHFRLGVFSDLKFWNPKNVKWEEIAVGKRHMVVVRKPPFARDRWTHVAFTFSNLNADGKSGAATLYVNGRSLGALTRPQRFAWEPKEAAIMLGLSYIGDIDDLAIFDRALTSAQVGQLYGLRRGVAEIHAQKKR
jgi:Concanavalin A-like lectin/glucanases superfamily